MALGEAQLVPLAHDVAAAHFAEFVGGQATDIGVELEPRHGLADYAIGQHGIAVDHRHHGIFVRQHPRDGAKAIGQAVTLAGAGDTHDVQLDVRGRVVLGPQALHQQFIGHLHQRADHGGGEAAVDRFADHRAVHLGGGQRVDAKAGDHQVHVRRVGRVTELVHLAAQVRVHDVEEDHAADEMGGAHGVAPDADCADQEDEVLRLRVEDIGWQGQGDQHEQAHVEQPTGALQQHCLEPLHVQHPSRNQEEGAVHGLR
ncbi:hypothetical protein D3C76_1049730 [compost metagenome]